MYYNGNQQLYTRIEHFPISWLKNITALNLYASFSPFHSFTILSHSLPFSFYLKLFGERKLNTDRKAATKLDFLQWCGWWLWYMEMVVYFIFQKTVCIFYAYKINKIENMYRTFSSLYLVVNLFFSCFSSLMYSTVYLLV